MYMPITSVLEQCLAHSGRPLVFNLLLLSFWIFAVPHCFSVSYLIDIFDDVCAHRLLAHPRQREAICDLFGLTSSLLYLHVIWEDNKLIT